MVVRGKAIGDALASPDASRRNGSGRVPVVSGKAVGDALVLMHHVGMGWAGQVQLMH